MLRPPGEAAHGLGFGSDIRNEEALQKLSTQFDSEQIRKPHQEGCGRSSSLCTGLDFFGQS